ncbi:MAG: hypothetical protein IT429_07040 [Gemmataceae bacterium]|nr:hypothetical protein [Gemmataceae bacterium]
MFYAALLAATLLNSAANRPDAGKAVDKADAFKNKEVGDITGYYACNGKEGVGKTYSGVAMITRKNDVYLVQWVVGGGAAFFGIGIRQGDTLACSWAIPGDKGVVRGVNLYRIESGPRLIGRWASFPGDGSIRTETLIYLRRIGEE